MEKVIIFVSVFCYIFYLRVKAVKAETLRSAQSDGFLSSSSER